MAVILAESGDLYHQHFAMFAYMLASGVKSV
jgi:hypothetical protein